MQRRSSMKVTVDAKVLFACLIKDSVTRRLFFNPALALFSPEFIVDELLRHVLEIKEKSGLGEEELYRLTEKVFGQIALIPDKDLTPFLPGAAALVKDPKDWLYVACALRSDTSIWSNDSDFGFQRRFKILKTKELVSIVGSL